MTLAQYKKVVITAVQEVEDALVQLQRKESELTKQKQNNVARSAFNEAQNRYIQGLSSYIPVLTALVGMQAERNADCTRQLISHRIQLYRALGGGMKPPKQEESK